MAAKFIALKTVKTSSSVTRVGIAVGPFKTMDAAIKYINLAIDPFASATENWSICNLEKPNF